MMVYCSDRSTRLPRKKKRAFVPKSVPGTPGTTVIASPHMGPSHREIPSVLLRRMASGKWLTKEQDRDNVEADRILSEIM